MILNLIFGFACLVISVSLICAAAGEKCRLFLDDDVRMIGALFCALGGCFLFWEQLGQLLAGLRSALPQETLTDAAAWILLLSLCLAVVLTWSAAWFKLSKWWQRTVAMKGAPQ
ncbi:hypothetical protein [Thalassospira xiamenensis]|uniref:Uncharacterized protein n=1 Tax=Thalassospira xiamenensis TaxID=220697 RepID=A0A285TGR7_9PROT|nr:hypothetical protein [Thalassospira xiamenensis]SOC21370.1 hypothetical protein SAMN05428964_103387 [Thalassospira xiamenensis]